MLVAVNGAAALLLLAMRDLDSTTTRLVAAALAVNVVLLIDLVPRAHPIRPRALRRVALT
jgi:hypothetical protein